MTSVKKTQSAILYQNPEKTITLLDIPKSISLAQGTPAASCTKIIYSSPPLEDPYPSTEPKSEAAKANVMRIMKTSLAGCPESLLLQALEEIQANYGAEWCLPRHVSPHMSIAQKGKRKFSHDQVPKDMVPVVEPVIEIPMYGNLWYGNKYSRPVALNEHLVNKFPSVMRIAYQFIHNLHSTPISLLVKSADQTYSIPPGSAFYLANINDLSVAEFSTAVRSYYSAPTPSAGPGQFDLVLLDPPWDNRSVRRSREYNTIDQCSDPITALRDMLGVHIAPQALVACWITNKVSARDRAIEAFRTWGVELIEEWTWLKTTIKGQPVTDIKGLWRKPYEVLLLGRKSDLTTGDLDESCLVQRKVHRRIIVATPDLHSRKPCLKAILEPMISDPTNYRALEIFARNLTSGWCSWGNEVIKYNWQGHWPDIYT